MTKAKPPVGLRLGGRRLWKQVMDDFELDEHERSVLLQACRIADTLDRLQKVIDDGDVVVASPQGMKANPAIVEFRQQAVTLAKCMASLRIPMGEEESAGRKPQQRVGVRRASAAT
ncbi:terminase [Herbiconiux sp. CPCC 205716]|uniref:Terminase n=1 Tax=Herbiconiux gentiana TaxID=2970912 RepID=A0ABT2GHP3_9MICO|nr:terminase [Herbiconiux gentiana]MCS5715112.1 terminase [Herbiconiux gentiana]